MVINLDLGIIPASNSLIKKDLGINDTQIGFLGPANHIGFVLGSVFAGHLF